MRLTRYGLGMLAIIALILIVMTGLGFAMGYTEGVLDHGDDLVHRGWDGGMRVGGMFFFWTLGLIVLSAIVATIIDWMKS